MKFSKLAASMNHRSRFPSLQVVTILLVGLALCGRAFSQDPLVDIAGDGTVADAEVAPVSDIALQRIEGGTASDLQSIEAADKAAVIRIEGMIYGFTLESLQRRVQRARALGAKVIVIDLDTPGGTVDSALKISRFIKSMPETTVAWVNPTAYSAGILIASSCDMILMAGHSVTGDCAPIVPGQNLEPTERAKALSPLLAEFRDNARANDHPYVLFHAMCVLGVKIYRIRHEETGQVRYVNEADYRYMVVGKSDLDAAPPEATGSSEMTPRPTRVTGVGIVTQSVTNASDRHAWVLDDGEGKPSAIAHNGQTLLTVTQDDALELGLADAIVDTKIGLKKYLRAGKILTIPPTWSELLAGVLTHPMVRAALMLALVMGAYMEFQSPGLGAPGLVAVLALVTLIGAPFLIGLSEMIWVMLFFLGVAMVVAELLFVPGFGLLGFGGLICILASLIMQIVPMDTAPSRIIPLPAPGAVDRMTDSALWMLAGLIGSGIGVYYLTKHFGSIPFLNRLVLTNEVVKDSLAGAAVSARSVSGAQALGAGEVRVGQHGRVLAQLRPSGIAEINNRNVDVISHGGWIEVGRAITVVGIHGNRIIVALQ